ncbi:MAG: amidohydrolase [Clostridia bacterium]|nr:amidohydrolase [Deltaproteobacteria bacterium]
MILALLVLAAGVPAKDVDAALAPKLPALLAIYKQLHGNPELSEKEDKTSAQLAGRLKQLGYAVTEHFGHYDDPKAPVYGVVAVLKNGPGATLLVRADMDALPVIEQTGAAYASKKKVKNAAGAEVGVMHACGHDVHMTALLGTAEMMVQLKDRWKGTLMLIAQPSEEVGTGARSMLSAGLYEKFGKPSFALGLHVDPELPAGVLSTRSGFVMANVDELDVTFRGVGGHGAFPHLVKDPIVLASEFVIAVQTLVSRETPPYESAVVSVGSIHGGSKHNVIPEEVKLQITVRSYKDDIRKALLDGIVRIANGLAAANGIPADRMPIIKTLDYEFTPATYNDPTLTDRVTSLWRTQNLPIQERSPKMGGEDFGRFGLPDHSVAASFFFVGATDPALLAKLRADGRPTPSAHSSTFLPQAEPTIRAGVVATVVAATELLGYEQ